MIKTKMHKEQLIMKIIFVLILFTITPKSFSQSLTERLGGIKTNFTIFIESVEMNIVDQVIIKRGLSDSHSSTNYEYGYAYGYGLQTFRLEFIAKVTPLEREKLKNRKKLDYYEMRFLDEGGKVLMSTKLYLSGIIQSSNGEDLITYSINLQNWPLIILDRTKTIRMEGKK